MVVRVVEGAGAWLLWKVRSLVRVDTFGSVALTVVVGSRTRSG